MKKEQQKGFPGSRSWNSTRGARKSDTNFTTGFTLIELLVVIAIIGILSAVVLGALNSARAKGENASIKSNLNNARGQAELYYDSNGRKYIDVCTGSASTGNPDVKGVLKFITAAKKASDTVTCEDNAKSWAIIAKLSTVEDNKEYWCVDSTGAADTVTTGSLIGTEATTWSCPTS